MSKIKKLITATAIIFVIAFFCNIFLINPNVIQLRQESYQSKLVNKDLNDFTILFFSDVYYGSNINSHKFEKMIKQINDYNADLVIFGGDMFKNAEAVPEEEMLNIQNLLQSINPDYGKFATIGDNDAISSTSRNITNGLLKNSGFEILDNKNAIITVGKSSFNLVGIDSIVNGNPDLNASFKDVDSNKLTIAICHTPDIIDNMQEYSPNILLSGHSLGGQIYLPFITKNFMYDGCRNHFHGKQTINNTILDITNGIASLKSTRLLADAEIVVYKLKTN